MEPRTERLRCSLAELVFYFPDQYTFEEIEMRCQDQHLQERNAEELEGC